MMQDRSTGQRDLWRTFTMMRRQLDLTLERRLQADAQISTADHEILASLLDSASRRLRAGQLADIIGWEKSRVSHQITRMEQRGLVRREECGDDARGVWVALTDAGSETVMAAEPDRGDAVREYFFDVLSEDQQDALMEISRRVLDTIDPPICTEGFIPDNSTADASVPSNA